MEIKELELYETPTTEVVELKTEGIVCGSPTGNRNGYGDAGDEQYWN